MALAVPADQFVDRPNIGVFSLYDGFQYASDMDLPFGSTTWRIQAVRFGTTKYELKLPARMIYFPEDGTVIADFAPWIIGKGENQSVASKDWENLFHAEFQRLFVTRPFEMSDSDRQRWKRIRERVDVERYRLSKPLIALQQGVVQKCRPTPQSVEWSDGTSENIKLELMPDEFACYRSGQRFEAMVHRNPKTYGIVKVSFVKRLPTRLELGEHELSEIWESLPTSKSLPDASP